MAADFYQKLATHGSFAEVLEPTLHVPVPNDWFIVISDVRDSTIAISEGRYKDVNVLGVASITGVVNVCATEVPYVFGGDGASLAVPPENMEPARRALLDLARIASSQFQLSMRVGAIPVSYLREQGHDVSVAKYATSPDVSLAMFSGSGLGEADRLIKLPESPWIFASDESAHGAGDFAGLECRWSPIAAQNGSVVSLLVQAIADNETADSIYRAVWTKISELAGDDDMRPVTLMTAQLSVDMSDYSAETKVRTGAGPDSRAFQKYAKAARRLTKIGRWLSKHRISFGGFDGRNYKTRTVANTDFRKFDGTLRMVIDISADKLKTLRDFLESQRREGRVAYGIHIQEAALMTCMVRDYKRNHVHFIDGAGGGYALAAVELKRQLAELKPTQSH